MPGPSLIAYRLISNINPINYCPQKALALTPEGIVTDNALCHLCGKCAEGCPALAMEISGTEYSVDYLMKEIKNYQKKLGMLHHLPDNLLSGKQCRIDGTMDTQVTTTMK